MKKTHPSSSVSSPISAMILSYNLNTELVKAVESLFQQSNVKEIFVLENHSTLDMDEVYRDIQVYANQFPDIPFSIIKPEQALSYSAAQNWALNHAAYEYVLLMNNDAFFRDPDSLKTSVSILDSDPTVGIVGHRIEELSGLLTHFGCTPIKNEYVHLGRGEKPCLPWYQFSEEVVAVTGAVILVRKTDIRFDEHYWFGYEDIDFCLLYRQAGLRVICNADCSVVHNESLTRKEKGVCHEWAKKQEKGKQYFYDKWRDLNPNQFEKGLWRIGLIKVWHRPLFTYPLMTGLSVISAFIGVFFLYLHHAVWTWALPFVFGVSFFLCHLFYVRALPSLVLTLSSGCRYFMCFFTRSLR